MSGVKKKVMVFGVFDVIHDGHRYFLSNAKKLGDELIIAIAQDKSVEKLKGRLPKNTLLQRINNISNEMIADKILPGDLKIGNWNILMSCKPDIVALGYDQNKLGDALLKHLRLKKLEIEVRYVGPYLDGSLHSSKLI